ncbi:uncharacterized protein LY89DRAFT_595653 [Mollisia scopiformis]|uniref:Uncharacterized protein n=1 Tax=Mollisia scopiformis TaxID=149040 RepID=A0A194WSN4_MOLSC|nr:uncharacterized protein LY89DRAFT_595653 [Mollisia scopiformis]KUJ10970.1 hypothetical protein LY89DRAFT_595653 [Mollisia scopiformis]
MRTFATSSTRDLLDTSVDEYTRANYEDPAFEGLREQGAILWITFDWDMKTFKATAWMPDAVLHMMKASKWECGLTRMDTWECLYNDSPFVRGVVGKGECWI